MKKLDVFYYIMRKNVIILLICMLSVLMPASDVVIWATTDMHGVLLSKDGGMARILTILEEKRMPQDILIDAGDLFQGSFAANTTNGSVIVNAFNLMNYDFYIPGNHEFEFGSAILRKNLNNIKSSILCANWSFVVPLKKMRPYRIIERNNMRIAIIGVGERESRTRILPDRTLSFMSEEKAIALALKNLRKEKIDLTILVRHGGIYFKGGSLYTLLQKFPEIDLVIGGHSHQIEQGRKISGAYYVQPGMLAQGISEIRVRFNDRTRKVERISSVYHEASQFRPSAKMSGIISQQRNMMQKASRDIIYTSEWKNVKNIQQELILKTADRIAANNAYLFFIDEAYIKTCSGYVDRYMLYRMFPYENNVVAIPVTQAEYKKILAECRKYSDKYKSRLLTKAPPRKYFMLYTTSFVLSGGGRNFPESRKIAELRSRQIKIYHSMRVRVEDIIRQIL